MLKRGKKLKPLYAFKCGNNYYGIVNSGLPVMFKTTILSNCNLYWEEQLNEVSDQLTAFGVKFNIVDYQKERVLFSEEQKKETARRANIRNAERKYNG